MKNKYVALYFLVFLFFALILINFRAEAGISLDEVWCYGFSKHIADGFIPYRDYNVVVTPLFFYIGSLFSTSLIWFRIYGALIDTVIVILVFYSCLENKLNEQFSLFIALLTVFLLSIGASPNYNTLLLLGIMISYLIAIKFFRQMTNTNAFLFGLTLSLALLIKQNVPAVLIVLLTGLLIILVISKNMSIRTFSFYALGGLLPVLFFLCYSVVYGFSSAFVNYTILGPTSFFSANYRFQEVTLLPLFCSFIISASLVVNSLKFRKDKWINITTIIFSLCSYILIYPIIDKYHTTLLLILNLLLFIPLFKEYPIKTGYYKAMIIGLIIGIGASNLLTYLDAANIHGGYTRSKLEYYNGIWLTKDMEENTMVISNYIKEQEAKGQDVAIVSSWAYYYNIPANDYNGILDLLNIGNLGMIANDQIIKQIGQKDIILTNEFYESCDIKEVREYVMNNYFQEGTIGNMKIFKKP